MAVATVFLFLAGLQPVRNLRGKIVLLRALLSALNFFSMADLVCGGVSQPSFIGLLL